jgi:hypothetical protein
MRNEQKPPLAAPATENGEKEEFMKQAIIHLIHRALILALICLICAVVLQTSSHTDCGLRIADCGLANSIVVFWTFIG